MTSTKSLLLIDGEPDFTTLVKFTFEDEANWRILTAFNAKKGIATAELEQLISKFPLSLTN